MIFSIILVGHRTLRLHHLHRAPDHLPGLRVPGGAGDEEPHRRRGHGPVQEVVDRALRYRGIEVCNLQPCFLALILCSSHHRQDLTFNQKSCSRFVSDSFNSGVFAHLDSTRPDKSQILPSLTKVRS